MKTCTAERVSDGGTVVAITAIQTKLRIRLLGIDAPEILHGVKPGGTWTILSAMRDVFDKLD